MSKARDLANAGTALTTVSATELGYLDGVTSAVQTQINSKIGSASAINPTIVDAKGDIIAATAADTVARLAVGSNDTVLTADSTAATGLKWATPSAGGMTVIASGSMSSTTVTLSSIPQTYKSLYLQVNNLVSTAGRSFAQIGPAANFYGRELANEQGGAINNLYAADWINTWQHETSGGQNSHAIKIDNYTSTSSYKPASLTGYASSNVWRSGAIFGTYVTNSAITTLYIHNSAGYTWTGGTYVLYGVS
jgi:hypothetical protein